MLKITHFEGLDNLMKILIPLVPNCAMNPQYNSMKNGTVLLSSVSRLEARGVNSCSFI